MVVTNRVMPPIRTVVGESGDVSMPYVAKLRVAGMTLEEAARTIEASYFLSCFQDPVKVVLSKLDAANR